MAGLRLLLAVLVMLSAGWITLSGCFRALKERWNFWEMLAFSWMTGMGMVSLQMFLYSLMGISFSVVVLILPWALGWGACFFTEQLRLNVFARPAIGKFPDLLREWYLYLFWAIILFQMFFAVSQGLAGPISAWDAWGIWFLKGRVFFLERGVSEAFLTASLPVQPDYPLLTPLCITWIYNFLGRADDQFAKILYPLQYVSLCVIFHYFAKEVSSRKKAAFFTVLLSLIPILMIHGGGLSSKFHLGGLYSGDFVGYADLTLAIYFLMAGGLLAFGALHKHREALLGAVFFASIGAWTKNEGLPFVGVVTAAVLFLGLRHQLFSWKHGFFLLGAWGLFIISWLFYKKGLCLGNEYIQNLSMTTLKQNLGNLQLVASTALHLMFANIELYNLVWYAYFLCFLFAVRRFLWRPLLLLNVLLGCQLGSYFFAYIITPREILWQMGTSFDRLLLQLIPLTLLATVIMFQESVSKWGGPIRLGGGELHDLRRIWGVAALLITLGLLIYSNTWHSEFHFDDRSSITHNPVVWNGFWDKLWEYSPTRFIPHLSFALNYKVHQESVFGYHLVNILIHILNAFLVYLFCGLLLQAPKIRNANGNAPSRLVPLCAALLFLTHPLQTQAVTYIVQRIASFAALFYLAAIVFYLHFRLKGGWKYYVAAVISCCCAVMSKENTFTLPVAILLLEWIGWGIARPGLWKRFFMVAPFFLVIATMPDFCMIRILTHDKAEWLPGARDLEEFSTTRWEYLLTQFRVICTYLRLLVFPVNQMVDYDYPVIRTFFTLPTIAAFTFLAGIFISGFYLLKKNRILSLGIFWFFLTLSIESSIFPIKDVIFEHRMYLPMVGAGLFFSYAGHLLFRDRNRYAMIFSVAILILGIVTFSRNFAWRTEISFWGDNVKKAPNLSRPLNNLGLSYLMRGMPKEAYGYIKRSIEADPSNPNGYYTMASYYSGQKDLGKAEEYYKKAIERMPKFIQAYYNLGNLYSERKDFIRAREMYEKAIKISPDFVPAVNNLGVLYFHEGNFREAETYFKRAIEQDPGYVSAHYDLGVLYGREKRWAEAVSLFEKVLALSPRRSGAAYNLGLVYFYLKNNEGLNRKIADLKNLGEMSLAHKLEKVRDGKVVPEMKKDFVKCESWDDTCFEQFEEGQRDAQRVVVLNQEIQEIVALNKAIRGYAH